MFMNKQDVYYCDSVVLERWNVPCLVSTGGCASAVVIDYRQDTQADSTRHPSAVLIEWLPIRPL